VKPDTLIRWHRKGFRLFWKWNSRAAGRPRVSLDVRKLIGEMAKNNPTWSEERIADELLLKIGIQISPRTVRRYMPIEPKAPGMTSPRWMTFVRNHAKAIIACDFFIVVTATFRLVYVFMIMEVGSRRILHFNATLHPTSKWTLQQFRECVTGEEPYKFVIHGRDSQVVLRSAKHTEPLSKPIGLAAYLSPTASGFFGSDDLIQVRLIQRCERLTAQQGSILRAAALERQGYRELL